MARPVIIDPEAQKEFDEATEYYRNCRPMLDVQFARAVKSRIRFITRHPRTGR
jgi:plasmid stabilization system protein ParE